MKKENCNQVMMKYNTVQVEDVTFKVYLVDFDKPNMLCSYMLEIKNKHTSINVSLESLIYKTTEFNYTDISDEIYYSRQDLWNLIMCNKNSKIFIPRFEIVCDKLREILVKHFKVDSRIIELYEYMYALSELNLYRNSYHSEEKASEMFYKYRMKNYTITLEKILEQDFSNVIDGHVVQHGGKFEGCWYDDDGRKRPITSPKWRETKYNDTDKVEFVLVMLIPFWAKFNTVTRHLTDDEIYKCYGGKVNALQKFKEKFPRINENIIQYLRAIALEADNDMIDTQDLRYALYKDHYGKGNYKDFHDSYCKMLRSDLDSLSNFIVGGTSDLVRIMSFIESE